MCNLFRYTGHIVFVTGTNDEAIKAARRIIEACGMGIRPQCDDVWKLHLSVSPRDASDLMLGHEELARKFVNRAVGGVNARPRTMTAGGS